MQSKRPLSFPFYVILKTFLLCSSGQVRDPRRGLQPIKSIIKLIKAQEPENQKQKVQIQSENGGETEAFFTAKTSAEQHSSPSGFWSFFFFLHICRGQSFLSWKKFHSFGSTIKKAFHIRPQHHNLVSWGHMEKGVLNDLLVQGCFYVVGKGKQNSSVRLRKIILNLGFIISCCLLLVHMQLN